METVTISLEHFKKLERENEILSKAYCIESIINERVKQERERFINMSTFEFIRFKRNNK